MSKNINISRNFADQLPRNLLANIVYFLVNVVIGIFLVPCVVSNLWIAAYGLIPLATSTRCGSLPATGSNGSPCPAVVGTDAWINAGLAYRGIGRGRQERARTYTNTTATKGNHADVRHSPGEPGAMVSLPLRNSTGRHSGTHMLFLGNQHCIETYLC